MPLHEQGERKGERDGKVSGTNSQQLTATQPPAAPPLPPSLADEHPPECLDGLRLIIYPGNACCVSQWPPPPNSTPHRPWGSLECSLPNLLRLVPSQGWDSPQTQLSLPRLSGASLALFPGLALSPRHCSLPSTWRGLEVWVSWAKQGLEGKRVRGWVSSWLLWVPLALPSCPSLPCHLHTGEEGKMHPTQSPHPTPPTPNQPASGPRPGEGTQALRKLTSP